MPPGRRGDRGDLNPRPPGPQPGALTGLSYGHHVFLVYRFTRIVRATGAGSVPPEGFEPPTKSLEGSCSVP